MRIPRLALVTAAIWGITALCAQAKEQTNNQAHPTSAHDVIRHLDRSLYVMAEQTGGSPAQWDMAESDALSAMRHVIRTAPETLTTPDKKGRNPLTRAVTRGYTDLVELLLQQPQAISVINHKGTDGLDAYDHALLAFSMTLVACRPDTENPFTLVPYLVTQPYYADRDPFPKIKALLADAGADTGEDHARQTWLAYCTNEHPQDRQDVRASTDLQATMFAVQARATQRNKRSEIEASVATYREIFEPWVDSGRLSAKQFETDIANLYRDAGLDPPESKDD